MSNTKFHPNYGPILYARIYEHMKHAGTGQTLSDVCIAVIGPISHPNQRNRVRHALNAMVQAGVIARRMVPASLPHITQYLYSFE